MMQFSFKYCFYSKSVAIAYQSFILFYFFANLIKTRLEFIASTWLLKGERQKQQGSEEILLDTTWNSNKNYLEQYVFIIHHFSVFSMLWF